MRPPPYIALNVRPRGRARRIGAADIVCAVVDEAQAGRLPPGSRLPPVRALQLQLGVAKNTVQAAYDELAARGLVQSRPREGVFVAGPTADAPAPKLAFRPVAPTFRSPAISDRSAAAPDTIELSTVHIDPKLLPRRQLDDCLRAVIAGPRFRWSYDPQGYGPLREVIAERMTARGMPAQPDDIVTTAGSQQAIDAVVRALECRHIAHEDPVYAYARGLFATYDARMTPLQLDPFAAIDLERWERDVALHRPHLFYAITSYQNPTGYSYSTYELQRLLELSERWNLPLAEDDWGSDMLSGVEYRPTLRALGGRHVVYINSFTKKLLPALRLGYVAAAPHLIPGLVAAKRVCTLGNASLLEAALCEFLQRGYYDTHLRHIQAELDRRYQRCLELLRERLADGVRFSTPGGGPTLWVDLPREVSMVELRTVMAERGVMIDNCDPHFSGRPHLNGFRIGYAYLDSARLERGIDVLAECLRRWLR
ncbi:MAG: PLP-dependent aminotransferase family protein [Myxococcales bacterium FL481]|nr:MAG: PLP-dependent aminotransferase family protein [Myxococcales bacterium FL481]